VYLRVYIYLRFDVHATDLLMLVQHNDEVLAQSQTLKVGVCIYIT
jgi:hypothetical protein